MKTYYWDGWTNYSTVEGWSERLRAEIVKGFAKYENALKDEHGHWGTRELPPTPKKGVYDLFINDHNGNINVAGYVVADNKTEARKILDAWIDYFYPEVDPSIDWGKIRRRIEDRLRKDQETLKRVADFLKIY